MNKPLLVAICLSCAGCATQPTYQQQLDALPVPQTAEQQAKECTYLRTEIARMQNLADFYQRNYSSMTAMYATGTARNNIALLEGKAAQFQCRAAFGN